MGVFVVDDEKFLRVKTEAQEELLKISGVRAVSFGFKHVNGKDTGRPAIVVKVEQKRPRSEVKPSELIPAAIEGIPTDVKEWKSRFLCGPKPIDIAKERPLLGGIMIQIEFANTTESLEQSTVGVGTLGFLAKTDGTVAGIPKGGIVGVTCQHVVADPYNSKNTPVGHDIGQPTPKDCSRCSNCCYDIFGKVLKGIHHIPLDNPDVFVDAALLSIDSDWKYFADVKGIGPVKDIRILSKPSDLGTRVQKRGAFTALTWGKVTDVGEVIHLPGSPIQDGVITVAPDPGIPVWDNCLPDCGIGGPGLENFSSFCCKGDSGSALLDDQRRIVGLLRQTNCSGEGHATGIDGVMRALGITVETATAAQQLRPVPKIVGINAMIDSSGAFAPRMVVSPGLQDTMERARQELLATPFGQKYAQIVEQRHQEVIELVNRNRRVATVWHRNGGPQMIAEVLKVVQSRSQPIPGEIAGKPLAQSLLRIQEVLMKYGTAGLAGDLRQYGPALLQFIGCTYADLLSSIQISSTE